MRKDIYLKMLDVLKEESMKSNVDYVNPDFLSKLTALIKDYGQGASYDAVDDYVNAMSDRKEL